MQIANYQEYVARGLQAGKEMFGRSDDPRDLFNYTVGELGEVINAYKHKDLGEVHNELGDTLWYLVAFIHKLGFSVEGVLQANIEKLDRRYSEE